MSAHDPALTALAQNWLALSVLHGRIEGRIERALQANHNLSAREYWLLDVLGRQHDGVGGHLQMKQVADAIVLSQSATTRLVTRLEDRGLLTRYHPPPTTPALPSALRPPPPALPQTRLQVRHSPMAAPLCSAPPHWAPISTPTAAPPVLQPEPCSASRPAMRYITEVEAWQCRHAPACLRSVTRSVTV